MIPLWDFNSKALVSIPAEICLVAAQQLKQGLGLVPVGRLISSAWDLYPNKVREVSNFLL